MVTGCQIKTKVFILALCEQHGISVKYEEYGSLAIDITPLDSKTVKIIGPDQLELNIFEKCWDPATPNDLKNIL